jgi:hypothetical protein
LGNNSASQQAQCTTGLLYHAESNGDAGDIKDTFAASRIR